MPLPHIYLILTLLVIHFVVYVLKGYFLLLPIILSFYKMYQKSEGHLASLSYQ